MNRSWTWLCLAVVAHLAVSIVHGLAHSRAHVPLSPSANFFVFVVIVGGPVAGLALSWRAPRAGGWIVATTMAASLVFGVVNHFVLAGPDHVAHVDAGQRVLFATTAAVLAVLEAAAAALAVQVARSGSILAPN